jgi:hypothetical protein
MPNLGPLLPKVGEVASSEIERLVESATGAVRSCAPVLNELCDKARDGEQQNNMDAAALMQQKLSDEPNNQGNGARNPEHRDIMLRKA